jgi:hypothetical protein
MIQAERTLGEKSMLDPLSAAAIKSALDVSGKLGLWGKLLQKLLGDPNKAAQQLAVALWEVRKTLSSLRDTILEVSYLEVEGQEEVDVRRALDHIESGALFEEIIKGKGSCTKIGNIYDNHLKAWFKKVLKPEEDEQLRFLFNDLRDSDGWAVDALERILSDAQPLAKEVRQLMEARKMAQARQKVTEFVDEYRPVLSKVSEIVVFMLDLEVTFLKTQKVS